MEAEQATRGSLGSHTQYCYTPNTLWQEQLPLPLGLVPISIRLRRLAEHHPLLQHTADLLDRCTHPETPAHTTVLRSHSALSDPSCQLPFWATAGVILVSRCSPAHCGWGGQGAIWKGLSW